MQLLSLVAHRFIEPIEKKHIPTEPFEAEQILEKDPCMAAMTRSLRQRARDNYYFIHSLETDIHRSIGVVMAPMRAIGSPSEFDSTKSVRL
jgi:hypothetical protein